MALPIYLDGHNGYKANQRPRQFELDDELASAVYLPANQQWPSGQTKLKVGINH